MKDPTLNFLKILGLASVTLYYARKTHQESLQLGSPEVFTNQTKKMADYYLYNSNLRPEIKAKLSNVIEQAANIIMTEKIKMRGRV